MNEYKNKLSGLSERLKSGATTSKLQEVKPLDIPEPKEEEAQVMCWIPKSLKRELKSYANNNDHSLTHVVILAIKNYLASQEQ